MPPKPFSQTLQAWLKGRDTTLGGLSQVFAEKSFAVIFILMMALPALPLPTGGVTHITELVTMLLSLELLAARRTIWLPKRWRRIDAGKFMSGKAGSRLIRFVAWLERRPWPGFGGWLAQPWSVPLIGLLVLVFTLAAFVAPPFSGLDTLPALGVVIISLAVILEDTPFLALGIVSGATGIALELAAGTALYKGLTHFF